MKKTIGLLLMLLTAAVGYTQGRPAEDKNEKPSREKMEQLFKAFLIEELDLAEAEAEKFWPAYDSWREREKQIKKEHREIKKAMRQEGLDSAKAIEMIEKKASIDHRSIDEEKNFLSQSVELIGVEKTKRFMNAKRKFKREVLERMRPKEERGPREGRGTRN